MENTHERLKMASTENNREPEVKFQAANPAMEAAPICRSESSVSQLLQDFGSSRQRVDEELHRLSDSICRERRRLRHVLDWAQSFLSAGSPAHHDMCRADSLTYTDRGGTQKNSPVCKGSFTATHRHPVSCPAAGNEGFPGGGASAQTVWHLEPTNYESSESNKPFCFSDEPCISFSFTPGRDELTWPEYRETPENIKMKRTADKQTTSQGDTCNRGGRCIANQRLSSKLSNRSVNQMLASDGATGMIKDATSCCSYAPPGPASNLKLSYETAGAQPEGDISGHQRELNKVKVKGKEGTKSHVLRMSERTGKVNEDQDPTENTSGRGFSSGFEVPPALTVYEQYQLCVERLHRSRLRRGRHGEAGVFTEWPAREEKTPQEAAAPAGAPLSGSKMNNTTSHPETEKHLSRGLTAAERTKEERSDAVIKNQDRFRYNRNRTTLAGPGRAKQCGNLTVRDQAADLEAACQSSSAASDTHSDRNKGGSVITGGKTSTDNVPAVEEAAALTPNPGLRIRFQSSTKSRQSRAESHMKRAERQGCSAGTLHRPQPSAGIKHAKRNTPQDKVRHSAAQRDTRECPRPQVAHTPVDRDPGAASPSPGTEQNVCKYSPAGVPVCERWLRLPDELWLAVLSLLPRSDLCSVLQVCSRLHTLASDHTLWRDLRLENRSLTEGWLLCVSRRRPRSVSLYGCSSPPLASRWPERFIALCSETMEEIKVTSCMGLGLHGDQMLPLIGRLCCHVTSVDVSWSGATDTGVKALSDSSAGQRLKSVVLNGCHVTDDPLMRLAERHKESLCRLEVFGCQFLTPACLQTIYQLCPGLQHLNIGQVPKVNAHNLTVMAAQLKHLVSLNLTGLQAVNDFTLEPVLQSCVDLRSLSLGSCSGVTDLTLHSISQHTPCIRALDVSGCRAVTDAGVQSLALDCRRLQQLDLSSTTTGNRGVSLLANYCSRHLHTVKLSFCHITAETVLKLCRRCRRLRLLHLYGCRHLPTQTEIREVHSTVRVYPLP